jgi:hypothetical protein
MNSDEMTPFVSSARSFTTKETLQRFISDGSTDNELDAIKLVFLWPDLTPAQKKDQLDIISSLLETLRDVIHPPPPPIPEDITDDWWQPPQPQDAPIDSLFNFAIDTNDIDIIKCVGEVVGRVKIMISYSQSTDDNGLAYALTTSDNFEVIKCVIDLCEVDTTSQWISVFNRIVVNPNFELFQKFVQFYFNEMLFELQKTSLRIDLGEIWIHTFSFALTWGSRCIDYLLDIPNCAQWLPLLTNSGENILHSIASSSILVPVPPNPNSLVKLDKLLQKCQQNNINLSKMLFSPCHRRESTPFHTAASLLNSGPINFFTTLPGASEAVLALDSYQQSPLALASSAYFWAWHLQSIDISVIPALIKCGGNELINLGMNQYENLFDHFLKRYRLDMGQMRDIIRVLSTTLTNTTALETKGGHTLTPFHLSLFFKHDIDMIKYLTYGQSGQKALFMVDSNGFTALHIAILRGCSVDIIEYILDSDKERKMLETVDSYGFYPLDNVSMCINHEVVHYLLLISSNEGLFGSELSLQKTISANQGSILHRLIRFHYDSNGDIRERSPDLFVDNNLMIVNHPFFNNSVPNNEENIVENGGDYDSSDESSDEDDENYELSQDKKKCMLNNHCDPFDSTFLCDIIERWIDFSLVKSK